MPSSLIPCQFSSFWSPVIVGIGSTAVESDFAFFYSTCLRAGNGPSGLDGIRGPGPNLKFELRAPVKQRVFPVPNSILPSINRREPPLDLFHFTFRFVLRSVANHRPRRPSVAVGPGHCDHGKRLLRDEPCGDRKVPASVAQAAAQQGERALVQQTSKQVSISRKNVPLLST